MYAVSPQPNIPQRRQVTNQLQNIWNIPQRNSLYTSKKTSYCRLALLGTGAFAKVELVKDIVTQNTYALKIINKRDMEQTQFEQNVKQELRVHMKTRHKNIVSLIELFEDELNIYLVLEYCSGGTLFSRVNQNIISEKEAFQYFYDLLSAVEYLHSLNIIHRDIKPENVLFTEDGTLKLCDFGWAIETIYPQKLNFVCGTTEYMPPEIILCQQHGKEADIWSLGMLLYVCLHGDVPFHGNTSQELYQQIINRQYIIGTNVSTEAFSLLYSMLEKNPSQRATIQSIYKSDWFSKHLQRPSHRPIQSFSGQDFNAVNVREKGGRQRTTNFSQNQSQLTYQPFNNNPNIAKNSPFQLIATPQSTLRYQSISPMRKQLYNKSFV